MSSHIERDTARAFAVHGAPGHAGHLVPSRACTTCMREAVAAWQAERDAYEAAQAAWVPYRPMTRRESVIGILTFPFIVVASLALFLGFYAKGIALAFSPLVAIGLDPTGALTWLLVGMVAVAFLGLFADSDRRNPVPVFPPMSEYTLSAWRTLRPEDPPRRPSGDATEQWFRSLSWADDAPPGTRPTIIRPEARRRRPSLRVREVIASWEQGDGRGDLPW